MKIYTRTGDSGKTSLANGNRVSKSDKRLDAYGTVDELVSFLGLLISKLDDEADKVFLHNVQKSLFSIGSQLAGVILPENEIEELKVQVSSMENETDRLQEHLPKLHTFVIPGGCETAALAHVCRTVCRRAERDTVRYLEEENDENTGNVLESYINRLSDYLFVLARKENITKQHSEEAIFVKKS